MTRTVSAALAGTVAIAVCAVLVVARQPAGGGAAGPVIAEPERSSPVPAAVPQPPQVPSAADGVPPLSFTLVTTWREAPGTSRTLEQRVIRGADRASLIVDAGRREWFFERNPVHRDRVSGWLVDHGSKEIHAYQESDLRTALRLRGWLDVVTMRVDLVALGDLAETGERREVAGTTFRRFRPKTSPATGLIDIWWSTEWFLPLELVARDSDQVVVEARVTKLSRLEDAAALAPPQSRFPGYRVLDEVDAGEHR